MTRLLALALALWAGAAEAQVRTDAAGLREISVRLLVQGETGRAAELARALLARNPDDRTALIVLAAAEPRLGRPTEGRRAAARAFELSRTDPQRFEAARLAALAAAEEGRTLLAEFWLRRALTVAPGPEQEASLLDDARTLRARSPWRVDVELGFTPSDNVNGGSETEFNEIDGLPFVGVISVDGRALSGWVGTTDLRFTRRLSESPRQRTELSFRLSGRGVILSDESRDLIEAERDEDDPEIRGSDFASVAAEARLGHRRALDWGIAGVDLTLGRSWYGDDPAVDSVRLSGFTGFDLGEGRSLRLSVQAEDRRGARASEQLRLGAEASLGLRVREADRLTLSLSRSETRSDIGNQASEGWGVRASYALGDAVGPARLGFTLGASRTEFPDYAVILPVPGGRQDERIFARVEAAFTDWSYAGFAPVVALEVSRSDSNVSRFDTESFGLGFTLRSSF